jgi:hypothetical protein
MRLSMRGVARLACSGVRGFPISFLNNHLPRVYFPHHVNHIFLIAILKPGQASQLHGFVADRDALTLEQTVSACAAWLSGEIETCWVQRRIIEIGDCNHFHVFPCIITSNTAPPSALSCIGGVLLCLLSFLDAAQVFRFLLGAGFVIYVMAYHQSIEVEQRGVYVSDE